MAGGKKSPYTEYTKKLMAGLTLPPKTRETRYVPSPETFAKRVTNRVQQILHRLPATEYTRGVATIGSVGAEPLAYPAGAPSKRAGDRQLDAKARASAEKAAPLRSLGDRVRAWARTADTSAMLVGPGAVNYLWLGMLYEGLTGGNPMHNDPKRKQFASELRRASQAGDLMLWSYYKLVRLGRAVDGAPSELVQASRFTWPGQTMHLVEIERLFVKEPVVEKYEHLLAKRSERQRPPEDPFHEGEDLGSDHREHVAPSTRGVATIGSVGAEPLDVTVESAIVHAFERLDEGDNQVTLFDLRQDVKENLGADRELFDEAMDRLRRKGVLTLSPEEGRFGQLPEEVREAGIEESSGVLVYAAKRDRNSQ